MRLPFSKKKNTSDKIKEATLNILARDGYDELSMRKIAKEADVALGQLTYYYKTKDNLVVCVVDEILGAFCDDLKNNLINSEKKVEMIVEIIDKIIYEDTQVEKLMITIISMSQVNKKLNKRLREFFEEIISIIKECYIVDYNINEDEAILKARLLCGSILESIIEKTLHLNYSDNTLIRDEAERLGTQSE